MLLSLLKNSSESFRNSGVNKKKYAAILFSLAEFSIPYLKIHQGVREASHK